ncbi:putative PEP-CTERM system TPR-repeat lipoprotein [Anaerohalosphaera lusitana]|uniref:Putative PEP-CTERM system TPR-repeat lipoprotein n=1 Tax=Anaerohalosphaera lusitana TaxID=1936003 RepID=A0A1U9NKU5_9BACT|nr:DUF5107 domain-containing protein [Anaerohalosphaera lusitana]AQT68344.1 putative PEP-CTERM system TPR-repeat lipoprotein [Anaerohalosphaera lusitana]
MKNACLVLLVIVIAATAGAAEISEKNTAIKTYPFGGEDPVPIFVRGDEQGKHLKLYPYTFFDEFTAEPVRRDWAVVSLENPYVKVTVMPEIGGKVWGALEKATGRDFIYANDVVKFREIALRGPWTSGGIEFNFGLVGHAPSTSTPVDYTARKNPDGSVSCFVGTMDLPSRSRWSIEIRLPADKAYFETNAFYYNPSSLDQSYYSWTNSAAKVSEDMQVIFPGTEHIAHDFKVPLKPWPISEDGRDLSWYKNNRFGSHKSYFTVGEYEDFFGCYWHEDQFGAGHYARYGAAPGRKLWLWALSRQGGIWEDLLTDTKGQYAELQAGRFFNQNDHGFLAPSSGDSWREVWFPYKDIGPMVEASDDAVLSVKKTVKGVQLAICALTDIDEELVVFADGSNILQKTLELEPMQTYETTVEHTSEAVINLKLGDLLEFTTDESADDIDKPINFHEVDESTSEGLYLAGLRLEKSRGYDEALSKYRSCVEQQPKHVRALSRIAGIQLRKGLLDEALKSSARAIEISMYDPHANYIYGLASRRAGKLTDAKDALTWAARSMQYRSAANAQLAGIAMQEKDYRAAVKLSKAALDYNVFNVNALQTRAICLRKLGMTDAAKSTLDRILSIEPLNHCAPFERYQLSGRKSDLAAFTSNIRNEYARETYVEMGVFYAGLGLMDEAVELFDLVSDYPTARYWSAYLQKSKDMLARADSLDPDYVFPFREESIPVFEWAVKNSDDWKPLYYLGLIYWAKGRQDEARELFREIEPEGFAPFYITRAHINEPVDSSAALADLKTAVKIDPASRRPRHHLITFHIEHENFEKAISAAREGMKLLPDEQQLELDLLRSLVPAGYYSEALEILKRTRILPFEGASEIHELYVKTHLGLGRAAMEEGDYRKALEHFEASKLYPERLGTGKPYDPDYSTQDKLIEQCVEAMEE